MNLKIISIDRKLDRDLLIGAEVNGLKLYMSGSVYDELMRGEYNLINSSNKLSIVDRYGKEMDTVNNCWK